MSNKQVVYWRRIDINHVYVEYKDNSYEPKPNPLDDNRLHGPRYFSKVLTVTQFELETGLILLLDR